MRLDRLALPSSCWNVATAALLLLIPTTASAQISFTESAAAAGIQVAHSPDLNVPIGGGTIWEDYDNDGDYDVYMTQGAGCNSLFLNDGAGNFSAVINAGGASDCAGLGHGGTSADFDNDGDADLYITNWGQNRYFVNRIVETGSLEFVERTGPAGLDNDGAANSSSAVAGDYDLDGDLDLYVGNHFFQMPDVLCSKDLVFENDGDGTFTEVGEDLEIAHNGLSGIDGQNGCALAATWSDFDMDGDLDLMIVNDFGPQLAPNKLYRNDGSDGLGGWNFADISAASGFDYVMFGMGIAKSDYDLDGDYDYYMADIGNNELGQSQIAQGTESFVNMAIFAGVEARDFDIYGGADGLVSWGPTFADLDNDGREDLLVGNGGAPETQFPGMFGSDYVDENPSYVYRNLGDGTFEEKHSDIGMDLFGYHRGSTVCDVDRDGDLDVNFGVDIGDNRFYINDLENTNWIEIDVEGTVGDRDGIGTKIVVTSEGGATQMREIEGGSSFLSLSCRTAHFGLGAVDRLESIQVDFLSGLDFELRRVAAGIHMVVTEPTVSVVPDVTDVVASPGDAFSTSMEFTNFSDGVEVFDTWVSVLLPSGNEVPFRGPLSQSLASGDSANRTLSFNIPGGATPGEYALAIRTGSFPDEINDQVFIDMTLE